MAIAKKKSGCQKANWAIKKRGGSIVSPGWGGAKISRVQIIRPAKQRGTNFWNRWSIDGRRKTKECTWTMVANIESGQKKFHFIFVAIGVTPQAKKNILWDKYPSLGLGRILYNCFGPHRMKRPSETTSWKSMILKWKVSLLWLLAPQVL